MHNDVPKAVPTIVTCHKATKKEKEAAKTLISMTKIQQDIDTNKFMQLVLAAKALEVPPPTVDQGQNAQQNVPTVTQESDNDETSEEKMSELSESATCYEAPKPKTRLQYPRSLSF